MIKQMRETTWVSVFTLSIGLFLFATTAAAQGDIPAAEGPVPDKVVIGEDSAAASVVTGPGSRAGALADKKSFISEEPKHDFFEGVAEEVDKRIWSISYWMDMAEQGLVPYSPEVPFEPEVYTSNDRLSTDIFTVVDSTDVRVTALTIFGR